MPDLPCLLFSDDIEPASELDIHLLMQHGEILHKYFIENK